jgi:hypothetical protein
MMHFKSRRERERERREDEENVKMRSERMMEVGKMDRTIGLKRERERGKK